MSRGTLATVSEKALIANLAVVKAAAPNSKVWSVVKANAYGHGSIAVARTLRESDGFAVATLSEAQELRQQGIEKPILLLEGVTEAEQLSEVRASDFHLMLQTFEQVEQAIQYPSSLKVWVKIDTGMHRLGVEPQDVMGIYKKISQHSHLELQGWMTHFACADSGKQNPATLKQLEIFNSVIPEAGDRCIANSAGIIDFTSSHQQWIRPGIMLYGASPFEDRTAKSLGLVPVMTLTAPVIAVRSVAQGDSVGYGHRWQARRPSIIATLAIGYGDGYPRHAPDGTPVFIEGTIVPLAGRVSMDMLMVDITDHPRLDQITIGKAAELWGDNLPVDKVAKAIGTIGYELLTRVSPRVDRKMQN